MEALLRDIRYGVRTLVRAPTFTVVAVATLALGIGANTAVFSVVDGVLLRDLPYEHPERLVTVWLDHSHRDGPEREWLTPPDFLDFRAEPNLFEAIGAWGAWGPTLTGLGDPSVLRAAVVSEGLFERVLRVRPLLGRGFLPEEDAPDAPGAVVLSFGFWQRHYGGDPTVLGRSVTLDEQPYTVVGVMPERFRSPFVPEAELWGPVALDPGRCGRGCYSVRAVARMVPGLSLSLARQRADALARRLEETYPDTNGRVGASVFGLQDELVRPAEQALWVLLGAVGFVLLIACTNVANLLLARGASRRSEFAVRVALGAGRTPIVRQLLAESAVLATAGGVFGLILAAWGTDALLALAPRVPVPGLDTVALDGRILLFTAAVTFGTGLLFGLVPAVRTSRADVYSAVRAGGETGAGGALRDGLVVTQVAVALVLLVGAGLLIRSFQRLTSAELGFNPDHVLTVALTLPTVRFDQREERIGYFRELQERLESLPGVVSVGGTNSLPLQPDQNEDADFVIQGRPRPAPPEANTAWIRRVTPGYFRTVQLRLLEGREFEDGDGAQAPPVVIVNEALARRYYEYPRVNPVGTRVTFGGLDNPTWRTIVGVVQDTRHFGVRGEARAAMYVPYEQVPSVGMNMVVRTEGDPLDVAADARAAVSAVDPALAASSVRRLSDLVDDTLAADRFVTSLLGFFAAAALVMAAVGLYGVISYGVTQRLREMGIRLALGAAGSQVQRMVVGGGLRRTVAGVGLGVVGALWLTRVLETLLYEVRVTDPATFVATVAVLLAVGALASWLPARRAGDTDPVTVLREE